MNTVIHHGMASVLYESNDFSAKRQKSPYKILGKSRPSFSFSLARLTNTRHNNYHRHDALLTLIRHTDCDTSKRAD